MPKKHIKKIYIVSIIAFTILNINICIGAEIEIANNGAYCWFQDPRAIYIDGKIIVSWVTDKGKLQIGQYDTANGKIDIVTIKEEWEIDDHDVISFLVHPDKRITIFYAIHHRAGLYSKTSKNPSDIHDWLEEVQITHEKTTYSHPVYLSDEDMVYVFFRGANFKPQYVTSNNMKVWSKPQTILEDQNNKDKSLRPYLKVISDGISNIHLAFTDGHPRNVNENSIFYVRINKGKLYNAGNEFLINLKDAPLTQFKKALVYDAHKDLKSWIYDLAILSSGKPAILYTKLSNDDKQHFYYVAEYKNNEWIHKFIANAGGSIADEREPHYSGGICFNQTDPNIIYTSEQDGNHFVIKKYRKNMLSKSSIIIADGNNVRPLFVRGGEHYFIYMKGEYRHYTNFKTKIMLHIDQ